MEFLKKAINSLLTPYKMLHTVRGQNPGGRNLENMTTKAGVNFQNVAN